MVELENNFLISLDKEDCQLRIGSKWFPLTGGTDAGDRKSYSYTDEKGIAYRIYYHKGEKFFEDLFVDDPNYQGMGTRRFTIPKTRQFINRIVTLDL